MTSSPSVGCFVRGVGRCVQDAPALVAAVAPFGWPRTVDRLVMQADLADTRGAVLTARRHRTWLALVGHADAARPADGPPTDPRFTGRDQRVRALEALADVSAEVDRASVLLGAPPGRGRPAPAALLAAVAILAAAAPVRVPTALAAAAAGRVVRSAPPLPSIVRTPHRNENLLTELVTEALPGLLSSAPLRHVVNRLRQPVVVGIRIGRVGTTVVVSRDALRVRNGISRRAGIVLEGGVEPLLRRAAGRVVQEAADLENR